MNLGCNQELIISSVWDEPPNIISLFHWLRLCSQITWAVKFLVSNSNNKFCTTSLHNITPKGGELYHFHWWLAFVFSIFFGGGSFWGANFPSCILQWPFTLFSRPFVVASLFIASPYITVLCLYFPRSTEIPTFTIKHHMQLHLYSHAPLNNRNAFWERHH